MLPKKSNMALFNPRDCKLYKQLNNNLRDRAAEKLQLFQRINVAVHRSNANMVLSRVPTRELEPVNMRFCRAKPPFTTCKRLRDDISEEGPLAKTPLCFVEVERESVN